MNTKDIKDLIEALKEIQGEDVSINIFHKLYGGQKIKCIFYPKVDKDIGFCVNGQDIYIEQARIKNYSIANSICFSDEVMTIEIKTQ